MQRDHHGCVTGHCNWSRILDGCLVRQRCASLATPYLGSGPIVRLVGIQGASGREPIGFDEKSGWIRLDYPRFKLNLPKVPWTKLLPWLRKARTGQLSVSELLESYSRFTADDLMAMNNVRRERPVLSGADTALMDHAFLLRCLLDLGKEARDQLKLRGFFVKTLSDMPDDAKRDALAYLCSSRDWPTSLPFIHPDFPLHAGQFRLVAEARSWKASAILRLS